MINKTRYDSVAKWVHWMTALAILVQFGLAETMMSDGVPVTPLEFTLFQAHKSLGISILALTLFRIVWRLANPPPPLPDSIKTWERRAAHVTYFLFYALLLGLPLTGWAMVSASGFRTLLFGFVPLPNLPFLGFLGDNATVGSAASEAHESLATVMLVLLALHVGAALKHHFIDRDAVLFRMAPTALGRWLVRIRGER